MVDVMAPPALTSPIALVGDRSRKGTVQLRTMNSSGFNS